MIHDPTEARRAHRLAKADEELNGYYLSHLGVAAQGYENSVQAFVSANAHAARMLRMRKGTMAWWDRVDATLRLLPAEHRVVLTLVYTPHGWPTWLADALSPAWGGGSFVALSATLPRAATASEERKSGQSILGWFAARGRGSDDALWRNLKDDCAKLRLAALEAYEVLRMTRIRDENEAEREAKRRRDDRVAAFAAEIRAKGEVRQARRFARKLGRVA